MKLWQIILAGILLVFVGFWVLAFAAGLLQHLLGLLVFAAVVALALRWWFGRAATTELNREIEDRRLHRSAAAELKKLERSLGTGDAGRTAVRDASAGMDRAGVSTRPSESEQAPLQTKRSS